MIELVRFKKRISKNRRPYYEAFLGTAHLLLFRNFDKTDEEDADLILYCVQVKEKKAEESGDGQ